MKSIRKDIVIEHDSIENLHLEKTILNQVNHPFIISMEFVFHKSLRIYFIMDFIQYYLSEFLTFIEGESCLSICLSRVVSPKIERSFTALRSLWLLATCTRQRLYIEI
jgi:serine/threonine protein kinase